MNQRLASETLATSGVLTSPNWPTDEVGPTFQLRDGMLANQVFNRRLVRLEKSATTLRSPMVAESCSPAGSLAAPLPSKTLRARRRLCSSDSTPTSLTLTFAAVWNGSKSEHMIGYQTNLHFQFCQFSLFETLVLFQQEDILLQSSQRNYLVVCGSQLQVPDQA